MAPVLLVRLNIIKEQILNKYLREGADQSQFKLIDVYVNDLDGGREEMGVRKAQE